MKLVRSGNNALRISLTPEDLKQFQVDLNDFDYDLPKGKKIIWQLFDKAREETGFDAQEERVYIQLYPKCDGGCELFVIKLEEEERDCFLFHSFDAFYPAWKAFENQDEITCYRLANEDRFLILSPTLQTPPTITEYGERLKRAPSRTYLRSHCRKI